MFYRALLAGALTVGLTATANARYIERMKEFQVMGTSLNIPTVPQGPKKAAAIRMTLERGKLPSGFRIEFYAIVPDARHRAVGDNVDVVFMGTRKTKA